MSFVSHFNKTKTTAAGVRVKHPVVIHNGIETAKFRKREPDKHDGTLRLLYVGQLHAQKGVHTTVEAVRRLIVDGHKDIRLTIAGGAPLSETYEQYIHGLVATENLERYVQFLGHIPREHIVKAYHDHDVLLFTSIVERGFPLVLLVLLCQFDIFRVYWGHDQETTFASSPQHANARTRRVFSPVSGAL